ncbi:hypothetical protein BDV59DRAFT_199362 [Aspergillus ambiguus]|uniref:uncharacterized protein n=1 Tax=Aspergillus ambiguus TaxID=176160 RepID=UPI003CCD958E
MARPIIRGTQAVPTQALGQPVVPALVTQRRTFRSIPSLYKTKQQAQEEDRFHDRNILDPQRSEVSKTGTDNEVAGHSSAYDPDKPSPESSLEGVEEESKQEGKVSNPLNVSPANKDVSHARDPQEGGPDHNVEKSGPSGRGWTRKHREVNTGKK